jgi:hypothetical protein
VNREKLIASEFYAFMALAAWLVYTQFVKPWLARRREPKSEDRSAEE